VKNGIIHSDRGSAHLANETKKVVKEMNGVISVGQRGKSSDNYPIELFWAVIKYECLNKIPYLERTIERIKNEVAIFLDWYHNKRRQSNLNYLTPSDKLKKYFGL
jgi:putative transposase